MRPLWFERELSAAWEWKLDGAGIPVRVVGRVDRVDGGRGNGSRHEIVDYKKKRPPSGYENTAFLQIGLYRELVAAALAGRGETTARLAFLEMAPEKAGRQSQDARFRELPLSREEFSSVMDGLLAKAAAGRFLISPSEGPWGHCSRCSHALVCRKDHRQSRIRADWSPAS